MWKRSRRGRSIDGPTGVDVAYSRSGCSRGAVDGEAAAGAAGGISRDVKTRGAGEGAAGTTAAGVPLVEGAAGAPVEDARAEVGDAVLGPEAGEGVPGMAGASSKGGSPRAACWDGAEDGTPAVAARGSAAGAIGGPAGKDCTGLIGAGTGSV